MTVNKAIKISESNLINKYIYPFIIHVVTPQKHFFTNQKYKKQVKQTNKQKTERLMKVKMKKYLS